MPDKKGNYSDEEKKKLSESYSKIDVYDSNGIRIVKDGEIVKNPSIEKNPPIPQ